MVAKILAWESSERSFYDKAVLVADNPDHGGNFVAHAESLSENVLIDGRVEKIYLSELGAESTRNRIQQSLDEGASLVSYIGHGGIHLWADENILNTSDIPDLALQSEQSLLLTMNCLNGYFHFPFFDSMAEG